LVLADTGSQASRRGHLLYLVLHGFLFRDKRPGCVRSSEVPIAEVLNTVGPTGLDMATMGGIATAITMVGVADGTPARTAMRTLDIYIRIPT